MPRHRSYLSRRTFMAAAVGSMAIVRLSHAENETAPHQATGIKAGEITDTSALIWVRLTAATQRNVTGVDLSGEFNHKAPKEVKVPVAQLEGACPGAAGRVRVRYGTKSDLSDAMTTDWVEVSAKTDFTHQFDLTALKPGTPYFYETQTSTSDGATQHGSLRGQFETAPTANIPSAMSFCVMTCQGYHDRDHRDGHNIYPSMQALKPKFVVFTGDNVYYDRDEPRAVNAELARYHWERMFSLPRQVELLRSTGSYWEKDDHDTVNDDAWPGKTMGDLTFAQGQEIFRQQVPLGKTPYRTFRWGRDLQIWFTEGRDFRSPNNQKDGPEKTIWGVEQEAWFKQTVSQSTATWKILISPTPLVGPDRVAKNDNHANKGFESEGSEIRDWLKKNAPDNFFVICGDRHWQYHSVHPQTGLNEFSVGAASDAHAGGSPGENAEYHRFHRQKGGFISIELQLEGDESTITFRLRDVLGAQVYECKKKRSVK